MAMFCKWKKNNFKSIDDFFKEKEDFFKEMYFWNKEDLDQKLKTIDIKQIKFSCDKRNDEICVRMHLVTNKKINVCSMMEIFNTIYFDVFKEIERQNKMDITMVSFSKY